MSVRSIEILRAGWGIALLSAPRMVVQRVHGLQVDNKALVVARILGARHLVQAVLSGTNPTSEILAAGVWVDSAHALTAFGLAAVDRERVRAGVVDGVIAALWAGFGFHDRQTAEAPQPSHAKRRDQLVRQVIGRLPGGRMLLARAASLRDG